MYLYCVGLQHNWRTQPFPTFAPFIGDKPVLDFEEMDCFPVECLFV